jgi:hypothetical protein
MLTGFQKMLTTFWNSPGILNRMTIHASDNPDREMQRQLEFLGFLTDEQRLCLPDWLVIAPPKTGTSWAYANLHEHPQIYATSTKELKYFSHRFETEDLRCYLAHFRGGVGKVKGEASPSYSILPRSTIRLLRQLIPSLKLIYMMRDPIDRAWSHAKHNFRHREANFKGWGGTIDEISDDDWIENLSDDWNRLCGDYLGQLQRWLSIFPREQVYVGFFEDLARAPRLVLRNLLSFLKVDPTFADSDRVTLDRVNRGLSKDIPSRVERHLVAMYGERTRELAEYLRSELGMTVPAEWGRALAPANGFAESGLAERLAQGRVGTDGELVERCTWQVDDDTLARLLARDDLLEMDFLGFNIARRGSTFVAYRMSLGNLKLDDFGPEWWMEQAAAGNCVVAENPYDLKSMIVRLVIARDVPPGSDLSRLRQLEIQVDCLVRNQADMEARLKNVLQQLETCTSSASEGLGSLGGQRSGAATDGRSPRRRQRSVLPLGAAFRRLASRV